MRAQRGALVPRKINLMCTHPRTPLPVCFAGLDTLVTRTCATKNCSPSPKVYGAIALCLCETKEWSQPHHQQRRQGYTLTTRRGRTNGCGFFRVTSLTYVCQMLCSAMRLLSVLESRTPWEASIARSARLLWTNSAIIDSACTYGWCGKSGTTQSSAKHHSCQSAECCNLL